MVKKTPRKSGRIHVSFYTEALPDAESVHLVGDFNDWDVNAHPMNTAKGRPFPWPGEPLTRARVTNIAIW